jgi:hypothetical protein
MSHWLLQPLLQLGKTGVILLHTSDVPEFGPKLVEEMELCFFPSLFPVLFA